MRNIWLLLVIILYSCADFPRNSGNPVTIQSQDTIFVVQEKVVHKTVYDTLYVTIEQPLEKAEHEVFVDTLEAYIGVREITHNSSPEIDRFLDETCGFKAAPYCAAFISYGLKVNGHGIPELPCYTPSFFPPEKVTWNRGDSRPLELGEVFGLYFKSKGRIAHIGVIIEDFGDGWCLCLEANTDISGGREGDGVYYKLRHKSQLYIVSDWISDNAL